MFALKAVFLFFAAWCSFAETAFGQVNAAGSGIATALSATRCRINGLAYTVGVAYRSVQTGKVLR